MSLKNRKMAGKGASEPLGKKVMRELVGVVLLAATVFAVVSLVSYSHADPSFNQYLASGNKVHVHNYGGIIGAYFADGIIQFSGSSSFLLAGLFPVLAWGFIRGKAPGYFLHFFFIWLFLSLSLCVLLALDLPRDPYFGKGIKAGGVAGLFLSGFLLKYLNRIGSYIFVTTLCFLSLLAATRLSINAALEVIKRTVLFILRLARHLLLACKELIWDLLSTGSERLAQLITGKREQWKERTAQKAVFKGRETAQEEGRPGPPPVHSEAGANPKIIRGVHGSAGDPSSRSRQRKDPQEHFPFFKGTGKYRIPPVSLLEEPPVKEEFQKKNEEELLLNAKILEKKLAAFGVHGRVSEVLPGPVITLYEYEPASGVKVSKIMNLADDLALSMRAFTVRILAPVPGKAVVGIEIPNLHRQTVYLRELLSSTLYQNTKSRLTIAIGQDTTGQPVVADLAQIPHLLIAGSTGSGKSVGVNGMICSVLLKAKPEEVKFIMIDPKMLELSTYDGIPHLISPVVTDPKKAASALRWAVSEMERRYKCLSEHGVRNIQGYNKLVRENKKKKDAREEASGEEELLFRSLGARDEELKDRYRQSHEREETYEEKKVDPPTEKMPYIVIVIDELADLMMTSPKDVEFSIARLAQMARAAGMHLIIATQRPSVDVLTGLIKANFPARIAYKVASRVDSRTILDHIGAEKLLGKGDLLFMPPGTSTLERIHGCWVSDLEVQRIVEYLKRQQKPVFVKEILKTPVETRDGQGEGKENFDPLYDDAVALVTSTRMASISMVQRKLRIGYNRAARMIEKMEEQGVVGPADGVKQREVYARGI